MKYPTYCLYDKESKEFIEYTDEPFYENCVWKSLAFVTEDWDLEDWNRAFNEFKTAEEMLSSINYQIKRR